jgi:hypothetical protein
MLPAFSWLSAFVCGALWEREHCQLPYQQFLVKMQGHLLEFGNPELFDDEGTLSFETI